MSGEDGITRNQAGEESQSADLDADKMRAGTSSAWAPPAVPNSHSSGRSNGEPDDDGTGASGSSGANQQYSAEPDPDENTTDTAAGASGDGVYDDPSLADELGVINLSDPIMGGRGRLFSVAGRNAPIAEFTDEFLILHPPQRPFEEADEAPAEEIVILMDDMGILVNEIGEKKKIPGAKFNGQEIFYFWQQQPGSLKHYAVWFDEEGMHHYLTINGHRITTDIVYKLRNMTHDGELTRFVELSSD